MTSTTLSRGVLSLVAVRVLTDGLRADLRHAATQDPAARAQSGRLVEAQQVLESATSQSSES